MKKIIIALAVVAVLAIGTAAVVSAQTPTPQGQPGWGCWGWGGAGTNGSYDPASNPTLKRLADKIGISAADLAQQLQAGKSVVDVANGKVSEDDLVKVLLQPQIDALNLRVKYGYLTQEQADTMLKYATDRAKQLLERKGLSFGWGWGPGFGHGMMGWGFGGPGMMGGFGGPGFGPRPQGFRY